MKLGSLDISKLYLGSTEISKAYLGSLEVFSGNAWDISTASYLQNFSVSAQSGQPQGVFFKPDGLKMYIVSAFDDEVDEYNLSSAWDISTATYTQDFSVVSQMNNPGGVFFKPDGTKMYVVGYVQAVNGEVSEYDLSSAWDISTASYLRTLDTTVRENQPQGVFFKPDGTKMYIIGFTNDEVIEYDLSSAWDISTASYLQGFDVSAQEDAPSGVFFKPDGLKMYVAGRNGDDVLEYNLSSAWDISTASYVQNFSVAAQASVPSDVFFKPDGRKMYVIGLDDDVNEYDLG